jgi:membrane associated rhomboid family serine protease
VQHREPIFNVPGAVLASVVVLALIHAGREYLLAGDTNTWLLFALSFIPARYAGFAAEIPGGEPAAFTSFVTHMLVHGDAIHLAINSAWILAFGSVLNKRMGAWRFLAFSIAGGVAGAVAFLISNPGLAAPVIGASGAVAAMMGGVMRFLFSAIDRKQGYLLREDPAAIPRMTLAQTLTDKRIVMASIVFVALNLMAIIGFGRMGETQAIAWEAHLGGYFFGLLAFAVFDAAAHKPSPSRVDFE